MSEHPDNQSREDQVTSLLRAAAQSERAPESLRDQVTAMRERAATGRRRAPTFKPAFRFVSAGTAGAVAAVVALVLALGGAGAPTLAQAAALAVRGPSSAPAPTLEPGSHEYLTEHVGKLHFPNWVSQGGWRTVGVRHDTVGNRTVSTVYYARAGKQIAYSIVSAPVIGGLHKAGQPYTTVWHNGRVVVAWEEHNHTCLLSATGVSPVALWHLASAARDS